MRLVKSGAEPRLRALLQDRGNEGPVNVRHEKFDGVRADINDCAAFHGSFNPVGLLFGLTSTQRRRGRGENAEEESEKKHEKWFHKFGGGQLERIFAPAEARRGSLSARIWDRGATKAGAKSRR